MAEIAVCWTSVGGGELVREHFSSNTVDGTCEVTVGHGSISSLDEPERLAIKFYHN